MKKLLFYLVLPALASCGGSKESYIPCPNGDSDCPVGLTCVDGACRPAASCESDEQCADGRICIDNYCRLPQCASDTDCPGTQHCSGGRCLAGECRTDNDCGIGKRCMDYVCKPVECTTDGDCQAGKKCVDDTCVDKTCQKDSDCAPGELCLSQKCLLASACSSDDDCPEGTVCENGKCSRPCIQDSDCAGTIPKVCRDGHCRQRCLSDATCLGGLICENGVCVDPYCKTDADCSGEYVRCRSGRCQQYTPCSSDSDCPQNYYCLNNICEELPRCAIDNDCDNETICQPAGCLCQDNHCHPARACTKEEDCSTEEDCIGGRCVPFVCRGPEDCPPDKICSGGKCIPPADPDSVYQVIILTPGGPIRSGQTIKLQALALKPNGEALPGILFDWSSSHPSRAAVDADGLLTGGNEAGETLITATARGSSPPVVSNPVVFTNFLEPAENQLRVLVVERLSGTAIPGAVVWVEGDGRRQEGITGSDGTVLLEKPSGAFDVHVFSSTHDFLSFLGISTNDVLVTLPLRTNPNKAGGFTGQMTFSGTGEVSLGLAGASIGGQLVDLNFNGLVGEIFTVTVTVPGYGNFNVSLPSRMVLAAEYQGFPISIKPTYYVEAERGQRTAWALGGKLSFSTLQQILGSGNADDILARILPYFALFNHGLKPRVNIVPLAKVTDSDDTDGDGDTGELRPDWKSFETVNLNTAQAQELAVEIVLPPVPASVGARNVVLLAGSWQQPQGFTPLGLTSQPVEAGGTIQPLVMKLAPVYGGLEGGKYLLVALAIPASLGTTVSPDVSLVVANFSYLPARVELAGPFLERFDDAVWSEATRRMSASVVPGCTVVRSTFRSTQGGWEIYLSPAGAVQFTLPQPPAEFPDPTASATMTADALRFPDRPNLSDLASFGSEFSDVGRLDLWLLSASRHQLP